MESHITKRAGNKITIETEIELDKSEGMLEMEEKIQKAVNEMGKVATQESVSKFDTDGSPIVSEGRKYTSKGKKKSN